MASVGQIQGTNSFQYCFNNPVVYSDNSGLWPEWLEVAAKVVAVAAVVLVSAVTVGTGGAALAAGIAFGTACGGAVGGFANDAKGESFVNGFIGGAVNGAVQATGTAMFGGLGTIVGGGVGSGLGTAITESLNNCGKPQEQQMPAEEIFNDSLKSAAIGAGMSVLTAGMNYSVSGAVKTQAMGLMPELTPGFGEMIKGFFSVVDDAIVYMLCW